MLIDMDFFVRVTETISFLAREQKIHILEPMCNVLFIICRPDIVYIGDLLFHCF